MRRLFGAAVALALAAPSGAAAADAPFIDWNPLLPSVAPDYHPSRERDCVDGDPRCVEATLDEMYRRFDRLYASCDHNAAFGITYIRVTEAIRVKMLGSFYEEPRFLQHQDRVFARMYFEAFDAWRGGRRELVPPAWREAFDAGRDRSVSGIGNLLMSMNAHINRDFPFMVDALGMRKPNGDSRKPDHDRGNEVLHPLYDDVLAELDRRFDDTISNYDVPGVFADDVALFQILQGWREGVWRNAELLAHSRTPEQRQAVADYIEQYALQQARFIRANTTISDSSARDAHCAAYRRAHRETGGKAEALAGPRRRLRVMGQGAVPVRVRCPEPIRDCAGSLHLVDRRGRRLAYGRQIALRAGASQVRWLALGQGARSALRRRGSLAGIVSVRTRSPWGRVRTVARGVLVR